MPDIIQLLPDLVANQIAAGEVIQRPASVVKELIENAIDAHATHIQLIVKDAGKTLIQIIDNGSGMSEKDAALSFERHATSKLKKAEDLFQLHTKGFRGEALASIAAIAQVELKTREHNSETGTTIVIEGGKIINQEVCSCSQGTSIAVKNIFFNVPARRLFLKSESAEFRHIMEEFERIAIPHPEITFTFIHNQTTIYQLTKGTLHQRVIGIFGQNYAERIAPIEERTDYVSINGFIGKPEFARKTRGEQFFFINNRFVKNSYLHHAIQTAYKDLLTTNSFPSYFIFINVDPKTIDVNIHPTKTEIKFEDERLIYTILRSTIRLSLGKYNLAPTLDFSNEDTVFAAIPYRSEKNYIPPPRIDIDPDYNPFNEKASNNSLKTSPKNWETLYDVIKHDAELFTASSMPLATPSLFEEATQETDHESKHICFQLHLRYILSTVKSGLMLTDIAGAHERILFESLIQKAAENAGASQQELFPRTLELPASDTSLLMELLPELGTIGLSIEAFGKNTFVINGIPAEIEQTDGVQLVESVLEQYKVGNFNSSSNRIESIAKTIAKKESGKTIKPLSQLEMKNLIDRLFACELPSVSPSGKKIVTILSLEELDKLFLK